MITHTVHVSRIIVLKQNKLEIRAIAIICSAHINIFNEFLQKFSILHLWK